MSITGLAAFDSSIHLTNGWLKELSEILDWRGGPRAGRIWPCVPCSTPCETG